MQMYIDPENFDYAEAELTRRQRTAINKYAAGVGPEHIPMLVNLVYHAREQGEPEDSIASRLEVLIEPLG